MILASFERDRGLKTDIDVAVYEKQDGKSKAVGSARNSRAVVNVLDKFQRCLHGIDLHHEPGADIFVVRVVLFANIIFSVSILMKFTAP